MNVVNISGAAYVVTTNINQAMFFFTQAQVRERPTNGRLSND